MSYKASAWAVDQVVGDPIAKLILLTLAESADIDHQHCWPSMATIARRAECSLATVKRKLRLLSDRKLIGIHNRFRANGSQQSSFYKLLIQKVAHTEPGEGVTQSPLEPVSRNQSGTLSQKEGRHEGGLSLMNPNPKPKAPRLRPPTRTQLDAFYLSHPECEWQIEAGVPDRLQKHRWKVKGRPVWNWKAMLLALDDPLGR